MDFICCIFPQLKNFLSEVSQAQKAKGHTFPLCRPSPNASNIIYLEMYTEHVSKNGTGRGDQGRRKKKEEKTANYNKVHHICAGTRHKETHRKLLNSTG
jgi:hypothetical protein